MKEFINQSVKEASGTYLIDNRIISCALMTYLNDNSLVFGIHIPYIIKKLFNVFKKDDTPLDYANKFEELTKIKSVTYLKTYRDYYGQIE